jgi:hypothetical protein
MDEAAPMPSARNWLDLDGSTALPEILIERHGLEGIYLPRDAENRALRMKVRPTGLEGTRGLPQSPSLRTPYGHHTPVCPLRMAV